jgi:hypothetical protein
VEVDVGATPIEQADVTVVDPGVTTASAIFATMSWEAPTGKDADDVPMDTYVINVGAGDGEITIRLRSLDGLLYDKYKINYLVG